MNQLNGGRIGIDAFGESGHNTRSAQHFELTAERVPSKAPASMARHARAIGGVPVWRRVSWLNC
jgi:hypothetical protein